LRVLKLGGNDRRIARHHALLHFVLLIKNSVLQFELRCEWFHPGVSTGLNLLEGLHLEDAGRSNLAEVASEVTLYGYSAHLGPVDLFESEEVGCTREPLMEDRHDRVEHLRGDLFVEV
jgi:hypothetical protein